MEHRAFAPLVMSGTGEMARESSKFYSRLSELISEKRETKNFVAATWILQKIISTVMKSSGMCISFSSRKKLEQSNKENKCLNYIL